jgi:hypothetical protein
MNGPPFALVTVDTMEDLRKEPQPPRTPFKNGSTCLLLGYYAPGDGGGGVFRYEPADPALETADDDDGGVIIRPALNPTKGRWVRMDLRQIWAEYFGCTTAAPTDTARLTGMNKACDYCRAQNVVQLHIGAGYYTFNGTIQAGNLKIVGEGLTHSTLKCTVSLGDWVPFIKQPAVAGYEHWRSGLQDLNIEGFRDKPEKGASMHGVGVGVYVGAVARYTNVRVHWFDRGFVADSHGGHISWTQCRINSNYYGIYFLNSTANGDFLIFDGTIEGNSFANIAVAGNTNLDACQIERVHMGDSPYAFYQEGWSSGDNKAFLENCIFTNCQFESIGNAIALTENWNSDHADRGNMIGCKFDMCGFGWSDDTYRITGRPRDYVFKVATCRNGNQFRCMTAWYDHRGTSGFFYARTFEGINTFDFSNSNHFNNGAPTITSGNGSYQRLKFYGPKESQQSGVNNIPRDGTTRLVDLGHYVGPVESLQIGVQMTSVANLTNPVLYVTDKKSDPKENSASFTVRLAGEEPPRDSNIDFDWWIITQ